MKYEIICSALPHPLVASTPAKAMVLASAFVAQGHAVTINPLKKDK